MNSLLAHALSSLSFDERQKQQEILHGVDTEIPENDAMVNEAFQSLNEHLDKVKRGSAYETAESLDVSYVSDTCFRLLFLRGNRFDAKAAADQMIRYFQMKINLFGIEKIVKDITISDLDDDDRACLRTGTHQVIGTDQAGRTIWFNLPGLRDFKTLENELRSRYYMAMELLKSEQAQRRGVVMVTYAIDRYRDSINGAGYVEHVHQILALPIQRVALHYCVSNQKEYILGSAALAVIPVKDRSRIRMHLGSHMEIQYTLSTYGIPARQLPLQSMTNDVRLEPHLRWYNECFGRDTGGKLEMKDEIMSNSMEPRCSNLLSLNVKMSDGIQIHHGIESIKSNATSGSAVLIKRPGRNDVVLGRNIKGHGNQLMMSLVRELANDYDSAGRGKKSSVAYSIIERIHQEGGRFLQQRRADGNWEEVPDDFARSKISKCFRNHRRITKKSANSALGAPICNFDFWSAG